MQQQVKRSAPKQTALPIVREIERLAHRVSETPLTELECELLVHHMPQLLSEYRALREGMASGPTKDLTPAPATLAGPQLVTIDGGRHD